MTEFPSLSDFLSEKKREMSAMEKSIKREDEFVDRMEKGNAWFAWIKVKKELELFLVDLYINDKNTSVAIDLIRDFILKMESLYPELKLPWKWE